MNIEILRNMLFWCAVINYGVLLIWVLFSMTAHNWMQQFYGKLFHLSGEQLDFLNYGSMALFKIGIFLFNLVPYLALRIVG